MLRSHDEFCSYTMEHDLFDLAAAYITRLVEHLRFISMFISVTK